jgi:hypothetical protein
MSVLPVEDAAVTAPTDMEKNPYALWPAVTINDKGQKRSAGHPAQPSTISTAEVAASLTPVAHNTSFVSPPNISSLKHPMSVLPVEDAAVTAPTDMEKNPYALWPAVTINDKGQKRSAGHPAQPSTISTAEVAASLTPVAHNTSFVSPPNISSLKHPMSVLPVEDAAVTAPSDMQKNPYALWPAVTINDKGQKRSAGHPAQPSTMSTAEVAASLTPVAHNTSFVSPPNISSLKHPMSVHPVEDAAVTAPSDMQKNPYALWLAVTINDKGQKRSAGHPAQPSNPRTAEPAVSPMPVAHNTSFVSPPNISSLKGAGATAKVPPPIRNPYASPRAFTSNNNKRQKISSPSSSVPSTTRTFSFSSSLEGMMDFFAPLLQFSVRDYVESGQTDEGRDLWHRICHCRNLPIPTQCLCDRYSHDDDNDATTSSSLQRHFQYRAALVLEEARYGLATTLTQRWALRKKKKKKTNVNRIKSERAQNSLVVVPQKNYGQIIPFNDAEAKPAPSLIRAEVVEEQIIVKKQSSSDDDNEAIGICLTFQVTSSSKAQLTWGTVVECQLGSSSTCSNRLDHAYLGLVSNFSSMNKQFSLLFFLRPDIIHGEGGRLLNSRWTIQPIDDCCWINLQRQFAAVANVPDYPSPFLESLLGKPSTTSSPVVSCATSSDYDHNCDKETIVPLNTSQAQAMTTFLHSDPNSITIVQGPPGTGKTNLIVGTIWSRYLQQQQQQQQQKNNRGQLLVCAKTNTAIGLLVRRFHQALSASADCNPKPIVLLLGDENKLL